MVDSLTRAFVAPWALAVTTPAFAGTTSTKTGSDPVVGTYAATMIWTPLAVTRRRHDSTIDTVSP